MGVARLAKVTVIAPRSDYPDVAKALAKFEDFHPMRGAAQNFDPGVQELTVKAVRLFAQADQATKDLGLKLMPGQMDVVFRGVKVPRSSFEATTWKNLLDRAESDLAPMVADVVRQKTALQKAQKDEADAETLLGALRAVSGFSSDLTGVSDLALFKAVVSTVGIDRIAEFRNSLPGAIFISQPISREDGLVLAAVGKTDEGKLDKVMKLLELKPLAIPSDFPQNPSEAFRTAVAQHERAVAEREKFEGQLASLREQYGALLLAIRELTEAARSLLDEARISGEMKRMAMISGYIPAKRETEMREQFGRWIVHTEDLDGEAEEGTPTLMENNRWSDIFRPITLEQGTPGGAEVDPTPIVPCLFPSLSGLMIGDARHGSLLTRFMLFGSHRSTGNTRRWANIFLVAGVSATIFGVIFGEFFELSLYSFVPIPAAVEIIHRVAGSPDTFMFSGTWSGVDLVLIVSVLIGVAHLTTALALDVYQSAKEHNRVEILLERLPALTMYLSGVGYGLAFIGAGYTFNVLTSPAPNPLLGVPNNVLGAVSLAILIPSMIILAAGKGVAIAAGKLEGSVGGALSNGGLEVFERISQFLSNTISYIRLGVMLLVHAALLLVVNMEMPLSNPLNIVPWVIFNILILAFEGLIVYIQDLRLHLYEFFTKFYPGSGVPFRKIFPDRARVRVNWL